MFTGSFTATGQYSRAWTGGRKGFSVGITIGGGTNSLTVEEEVAGAWYTKGSAKTATGLTQFAPEVDYTPGAKFRIKGGTFDTGPITYHVQGDIIGAEITSSSEPRGLLLETSDEILLETGDYLLLEAA